MTNDSPVQEGQILIGPLFEEPMRFETVRSNGPESWTLSLVGAKPERFRKVSLNSAGFASLAVSDHKATYGGDEP